MLHVLLSSSEGEVVLSIVISVSRYSRQALLSSNP